MVLAGNSSTRVCPNVDTSAIASIFSPNAGTCSHIRGNLNRIYLTLSTRYILIKLEKLQNHGMKSIVARLTYVTSKLFT